jgi:tripartite-type tricarboxylate transporter receptor subunit TctC
VPTVSEAGVPGYELVSWFGLAAPAGTPSGIVQALSAQVGRALADKEFLERLKATGGDPMPMGAAQFHAFLGDELARWGKIIRETGAKLE